MRLALLAALVGETHVFPGRLLLLAGGLHAAVNWKPLVAHLRPRWAMVQLKAPEGYSSPGRARST
jgi:hypothetical protein